MAAFRESYGRLFELRSLVAEDTPFIALTATATCLTRDTVVNILHMKDFEEIQESPNKANIRYIVHCMEQGLDHELYFAWLTDELTVEKEKLARTIIYCQTIKQCGILYATIRGLLGKDGMKSSSGSTLVEMLHSCTPEANKKDILESFQQDHGSVRLLIATIAFGMGVDCKGVQRIIHYGPSKTIEAYIQETGRAGRDGSKSVAFLLYRGVLLNHVDADIKCFVKSKECRRKALMKHFTVESVEVEVPHDCCDICAASCDCGRPDCSVTKYPVQDLPHQHTGSSVRVISEGDRKQIGDALNQYHKAIVAKLMNTTANGDIKTLTDLHFMLGFSEHQISQVLENIAFIFTLADVYSLVEIWDKRHAHKILAVVSSVFGDVTLNEHLDAETSERYDFDDEFLDEWDDIFQDDELFDMVINNLSLSQLDTSISVLEDKGNSSESAEDEMDVATGVADVIGDI